MLGDPNIGDGAGQIGGPWVNASPSRCTTAFCLMAIGSGMFCTVSSLSRLERRKPPFLCKSVLGRKIAENDHDREIAELSKHTALCEVNL